ncbi:N,N-dimethylformamidase beta subunit family domain-containing protein [Hymenobacter sp. HD11105]
MKNSTHVLKDSAFYHAFRFSIFRLLTSHFPLQKQALQRCSRYLTMFAKAPIVFLLLTLCSPAWAQNPIVVENSKAGNPASQWQISQAGDLSIQGFATDISYNKGQTARFKIKTNASAYRIDIYRLGYYQGNGARLQGTGTVTATLPQTQVNCNTETETGLVDCGNWAESAHWPIPADAVSGVYIAKLTRTDTGGASHIVFIVRDDASSSDLLFQTADATWQAYNVYGDNGNGKSLYTGAGGKASKVSYNRPFLTRSGGGGGGPDEDWLFNAEYPMIRWLEANGYNVTYTTNVDTDRLGNLISNHKVFMSVGHDEYWSKAMRDNVTAARNAGKHLAFFSGNEVYWKVRWESSGAQSHRTLVCYKEGAQGENVCTGKCDPSPEWTGLWRGGCNFPNGGACLPENELTGQISWTESSGPLQVPAAYKDLRFWRNTSVATLGSNATATFTDGTIGYEWNPEQEAFRSTYPAGRIILSRTELGGKIHHLSLYRHNSGALVFGAGTVQWSWGLDSNHDRGSAPASRDMKQATVNLFADMGVQPATLEGTLVAATASTDTQAPTVAITSPTAGATLPGGQPITISGTASDANVVAGVEVSTDGGTSWQRATGTTNWTYAWTPTTQGPATIRSRAFDDSGNMGAPVTVSVTISEIAPPTCPCTVFQPTTTPTGTLENDGNQAIQLGMKFRATTNGFITGTRFYKQTGNIGTHTGQLYSSTGTLLASATFINESASGWQQVAFGNPVAITAGTTYIISYHSSAGHYSADNSGFAQTVINGPLRGLANGEDGTNGVYAYTPSPGFPTQNFQSSNYFVDVVFANEVGPDTSPPTVVSTTPAGNAAGVAVGGNISIAFDEALNPATVTSTTVQLLNGSSSVAASVTYDANTRTATLDPTASLSYATTYTISVRGGNSDPRIKDAADNALAATYTSTFTTQNAPATPPVALPSPNEGPGGPILVISSTSNPFSRFPVEILRAEGFNEFAAKDITEVRANGSQLSSYDVIVLGHITLQASDVTLLTNWVTAGGTLIALRPDAQLAPLLGITPVNSTLLDKYLLVNTTSGPGVGIVNQTIQFHSAADLYTLNNGTTSLATLYSAAGTATSNPAVTQRIVGTNGGKAVAFTYDLARSIVYTRQGNPAWAGQKRDGQSGPIRSDDMFFPDWVDLSKVAIPQADEQQRLLANIMIQGSKKPLPRFWYLPRGLKAAVIMTGDDHGTGGTISRFNQYISQSSANTAEAVANWTAIRGTSYIYPNTPLTNAQAAAYEAQGFEIGLHLNTECQVWTPTTLRGFFNDQLAQMAAKYTSIAPTITHRTHCISYSDWASKPKIGLEHGIRLDANYYYWPGAWVQDRPGMFTGSGMLMRFADLDGSLIDVYQAATQLTDESNITYSNHINTLLDNALGSNGYYGVFTANMHTDFLQTSIDGSNAIVAAAQQRQVPVVSAKQMLTWLDGRNNSSFGAMTWTDNKLNFTVTLYNNVVNLQGMLPMTDAVGSLTSLTVNGSPVTFRTEKIKGIDYAFFPANNGNYIASYSADTPPTENIPPVISAVSVTQPSAGAATITWTTDKASDSKVIYGTDAAALSLNATNPGAVTSHSVALSGLAPSTTYYYRVVSVDAQSNSTTEPTSSAAPLSFTTPAAPSAPIAGCFVDQNVSEFSAGTTGTSTYVPTTGGVQLKPAVLQDFTTTPPTTEWQSFSWTGGTTTFAGGQAVVDGARFNTEPETATLSPGSSLEFVATFGAEGFQHVGFGAGNDDGGMYNNTPIWAMFSTGNNAGTGLKARVNNNGAQQPDINLPGDLIGSAHTYRIDWKAASIDFYVDGTLVHTASVALATPMRVGVSDFNAGGAVVSMDQVRVTPYASSGSFASRIYDGGTAKTWKEATWQADTPTGTSIQLFQRQGNTATPDNTWTAFAPISASGATVGGTSRYIQYRADLSSTAGTATPTLQSMAIDCATPTCPTVAFTPASGALAAGTVGSAYNQTISTSPNGYTFSATGLPAGLSISTTTGVISGSPTTTAVNAAVTVTVTNGTCTATASYTLTINNISVAGCFQDQTVGQFSAGTLDASTYALPTGGMQLKPAAFQDFTATPPTSEWQTATWDPSGSARVANGVVALSQAHIGTTATYGPGSSVEFVATFRASSFQNIGFTKDFDFNSPWAVIGTGNSTTGVFARTSDNASVQLPGNLLNEPHRYRIDWNATNFTFYVDGVQQAVINFTVSENLLFQASAYNASSPALELDEVRVMSYPSSGSFASRIYDGGAAKTWREATWVADLPAGTSLQLFQRQGNTATPDGNWTEFTPVASSGATVGGTSRYIQYRADLSTTTPRLTPTLQAIGIACATPECATLVFAPATGTTLTAATVGSVYSQTISTTPTGYSFSATGLPAGLSIDASTGVISGTPTAAAANVAVTVTATQGACSATASYTLTVNAANAAPVLASIGSKSVTATTLLTFTASASDDAGSTLTYSLTGTVPAGAAIAPQTGVFTWTPTLAQVGTHTFTVVVSDGSASDSEEITVTVLSNAPTDISLSQTSVAENQPSGTVVGSLSATAPGTATFSYSLVTGEGATDNAAFVIAGSSLNTNAVFDFETKTSYSIRVRATENGNDANSFEKVFAISVTNVNEAPVLASIGPKSVTALTLLSFSATATDPESQTLTFSLAGTAANGSTPAGSVPAGATISPAGAFSWSPTTSQVGTHTFRVVVSDGTATDEETITVTVNSPAPTCPTLAFAPATGTTLTAATVGSAYSQTISTTPTGYSFSATGLPTGLTINEATGSISGTPTAAVTAASITVTATKGECTATANYTLMVGAANRAPVLATIGPKTVNALSTLTFTALGTDPDAGQILTYSLVGSVPTGATIDATTGEFSWTPTLAQISTQAYALVVKVSDGVADASETVSVTVTSTAPTNITLSQTSVAENQSMATVVGSFTTTSAGTQTYTYSLLAGLGGADNAAFQITGNQLLTNDMFDFEAKKAYSILVRATDASNSAIFFDKNFIIAITDVNEAPAMAEQTFSVLAGSSNNTRVGVLIASDPDAGQSLSYSIIDGNKDGAFSLTGVNLRVAKSSALTGDNSPFVLTIRVTDNGFPALSTLSTVTVNVSGGNRAPVLTGVPASASIPAINPYTFTAVATDPDNDPISFSLEFAPSGALIDANTGVFTWTPSATQALGTYSFAVRASDGKATTSASIVLTVTAESLPPTITSISPIAGPVGAAVTITVLNLGLGQAPTGVEFSNGVPATVSSYNYNIEQKTTTISTNVPAGSTTGRITVLTSNGPIVSEQIFTVSTIRLAPTITSFSPTSGPIGTEITVIGTNLLGVMQVTFDGASAPVVPNTNTGTSLKVRVPVGTRNNSRLTVYNGVGTVTSKDMFRVTKSAVSLTSTVAPGAAAEAGSTQELQVYPNPVQDRDRAHVSFSLAKEESYSLNLYDMRGSLLRKLGDGTAQAGRRYEFEVDVHLLPEGIYIARLITDSHMQMVRITVGK